MDNSVFLIGEQHMLYIKILTCIGLVINCLHMGRSLLRGIFLRNIFHGSLILHLETENLTELFMAFLKISLSRPRDILVIMQNLKKCMTNRSIGESETFSLDVFESDEFQNIYSTYFMSSLKDQLSFYYSHEDYSHFLRFFDFFDKPDFTFDEYKESYDNFIDYILNNANEIPVFVDDPKRLLQLLYESNIIAAKKT